MPIIVCKAIAQLPPPASIWLGGGAEDVKLRLFVHTLLRPESYDDGGGGGVAAPAVVDCSIPRGVDEEA